MPNLFSIISMPGTPELVVIALICMILALPVVLVVVLLVFLPRIVKGRNMQGPSPSPAPGTVIFASAPPPLPASPGGTQTLPNANPSHPQ